jgi:hypothetical protein
VISSIENVPLSFLFISYDCTCHDRLVLSGFAGALKAISKPSSRGKMRAALGSAKKRHILCPFLTT